MAGKRGRRSVAIGARCTAARARNRPVERPTHATVCASGVVCANACWLAESQCNAWRVRVPCGPARAVGTEGHTPIGGLVAAARRGSRCEGEARELTTAVAPRTTRAALAGLALNLHSAEGVKHTEHFEIA